MILSLGLSSRGVLVRYFMQSWFLLVPTRVLCHICLLCPFQSYLVSGGLSGSLSHLPPPAPRMSLPCPPVLLGRMQHMHRETQSTQSLQPFWDSYWGGATNYLLGAAMVSTFAEEASFLSTWTPQCTPQIRQQGSDVDFLSDWLVWSPCCIRDSKESSQAPHFKSSILWQSLFRMVQIADLYMITEKKL